MRRKLVVSQFESCSGGLRPPLSNRQGLTALRERRYSKLRHYPKIPLLWGMRHVKVLATYTISL